MEFEIVTDELGFQDVKVALPIQVFCSSEPVEYYDEDTKSFKSSIIGRWLVTDHPMRSGDMEVPAKEFKKVEDAVEYARLTYLKFLREELRRVRFNDSDGCGK